MQVPSVTHTPPREGGLTPSTEAAMRVAKAVAARETRTAQQTKSPADDATASNDDATASNEVAEAIGQAVIRAGAPEVQPPVRARLELDVDPVTERVIGRIVDRESGEVLKQIPPESTLKLIEAAEKSFGNLIDRKF